VSRNRWNLFRHRVVLTLAGHWLGFALQNKR